MERISVPHEHHIDQDIRDRREAAERKLSADVTRAAQERKKPDQSSTDKVKPKES